MRYTDWHLTLVPNGDFDAAQPYLVEARKQLGILKSYAQVGDGLVASRKVELDDGTVIQAQFMGNIPRVVILPGGKKEEGSELICPFFAGLFNGAGRIYTVFWPDYREGTPPGKLRTIYGDVTANKLNMRKFSSVEDYYPKGQTWHGKAQGGIPATVVFPGGTRYAAYSDAPMATAFWVNTTKFSAVEMADGVASPVYMISAALAGETIVGLFKSGSALSIGVSPFVVALDMGARDIAFEMTPVALPAGVTLTHIPYFNKSGTEAVCAASTSSGSGLLRVSSDGTATYEQVFTNMAGSFTPIVRSAISSSGAGGSGLTLAVDRSGTPEYSDYSMTMDVALNATLTFDAPESRGCTLFAADFCGEDAEYLYTKVEGSSPRGTLSYDYSASGTSEFHSEGHGKLLIPGAEPAVWDWKQGSGSGSESDRSEFSYAKAGSSVRSIVHSALGVLHSFSTERTLSASIVGTRSGSDSFTMRTETLGIDDGSAVAGDRVPGVSAQYVAHVSLYTSQLGYFSAQSGIGAVSWEIGLDIVEAQNQSASIAFDLRDRVFVLHKSGGYTITTHATFSLEEHNGPNPDIPFSQVASGSYEKSTVGTSPDGVTLLVDGTALFESHGETKGTSNAISKSYAYSTPDPNTDFANYYALNPVVLAIQADLQSWFTPITDNKPWYGPALSALAMIDPANLWSPITTQTIAKTLMTSSDGVTWNPTRSTTQDVYSPVAVSATNPGSSKEASRYFFHDYAAVGPRAYVGFDFQTLVGGAATSNIKSSLLSLAPSPQITAEMPDYAALVGASKIYNALWTPVFSGPATK